MQTPVDMALAVIDVAMSASYTHATTSCVVAEVGEPGGLTSLYLRMEACLAYASSDLRTQVGQFVSDATPFSLSALSQLALWCLTRKLAQPYVYNSVQ